MPSAGVTKRLAISELNFDKIPLERIFKIFSSVSQNSLINIRTYTSKRGIFSVAEFSAAESALAVYEFCDESEIEGTQETFHLSFVPDTTKLTGHIEECLGYCSFKPSRTAGELNHHGNECLELIEPIKELADCIPEDYAEQELPHVKKEEKKIENKLKNALDAEKNRDELEGFVFDLADPRFDRLYTDRNFILDASNKLFAEQRESSLILEERRRRSSC